MIEVDIKTLLKIKNLKISLQMNKLPAYPNFKNITIEDIKIIKEYVAHYPPYSEFSIVNLLAWNRRKSNKYCFHNKNLVIEITDEFNKGYINTVLGKNNVHNTLLLLLKENRNLRLIPSIVVGDNEKHFYKKKINIYEDPNNYDYIYSTKRMVQLKGDIYKYKRNKINKFINRNQDIVIKDIDLSNTKVQKEVFTLIEGWRKAKKLERDDIRGELAAMEAIVQNPDNYNIFGIGLYHKNRLIGYIFFEVFNKSSLIAHFMKGDYNYKYINDAIYYLSAKEVLNRGYTYINAEQDLGLIGLKDFKRLWRPVYFLKKFTITS